MDTAVLCVPCLCLAWQHGVLSDFAHGSGSVGKQMAHAVALLDQLLLSSLRHGGVKASASGGLIKRKVLRECDRSYFCNW